MSLTAELALVVGADAAAPVAEAVAVEAERPVPGTRIDVDRDGEAVRIGIDAADAADMRAAINSMLRFTDTALEVQTPTEE